MLNGRGDQRALTDWSAVELRTAVDEIYPKIPVVLVPLFITKEAGSVSEVRAFMPLNIRSIFSTLVVLKLSGRVSEVRAFTL